MCGESGCRAPRRRYGLRTPTDLPVLQPATPPPPRCAAAPAAPFVARRVRVLEDAVSSLGERLEALENVAAVEDEAVAEPFAVRLRKIEDELGELLVAFGRAP